MKTLDHAQLESRAADSCRQLAMLLLDQLGFELRVDDRDRLTLAVPEKHRASLGRGETVSIAFERAQIDQSRDDSVELVAPDGHFFNWLLARANELGRPLCAAPRGETAQIRNLAERLFAAYSVEGGRVQLAGCAMTETPFIRFTFRLNNGARERLANVFVDEQGRTVDAERIQSLHLDDVVGLAKPPASIAAGPMSTLADAARQRAGTDSELIATTLVWSKYCRGKLRFTIGEASAELPFEGWAETLAAPPFVCSETHQSSFHVAATDDGCVTVAEAIERCAISGARVLGHLLERSAVSGLRACSEHLVDCAVSHGRLLRTELVVCPACAQAVSPRCIAGEQCQACWPLPAIDKDDPRMARILDEYPGLDRWRNWRMKETEAWYLLEASGLIRRLLVVIAADTLEPLHLASANRLGRKWSPIDRARYEEFLR